MEAQMLLVIPAPTAGTSWEIEWVATNKFLHKTCFVMPPPGAGQESWWADNWRQLREWSVRLGLVLPEYTPAGCIFRLTLEGLIDRLDFSEIYWEEDIKRILLYKLLMRPNISWDFLYGAQSALEAERASSSADAQQPPESVTAFRELESALRFELSNWYYDAGNVPNAPGVILLYETPFRLLWAESTDDVNETLQRYTEGHAGDFTRAFFNLKVVHFLRQGELSQLLEKSLSIESIMSYRVRQFVSYRFCTLPEMHARTALVEAIWRGASKYGTPELPRSKRR
jgi:hypothetical protein